MNTVSYPPMPPARLIDVGEGTLSVHEAGPEDGPLVVLCHGWPELALCWAHQIPVLAAAGYRVAAPDMRGYGNSFAPEDVTAYHGDRLVGDLTGLLDALGRDQAVFVGHDWGGIIVWRLAMRAPERALGIVGVNTPHMPPPKGTAIESIRAYGGEDNYIVRFQEQGVEAAFDARLADFFDFMFAPPPPAAALDAIPMSALHLLERFASFAGRPEADIVVPAAARAAYVAVFGRTGLTPGVNWYRNLDANAEALAGVDPRLAMPCLMIAAECDVALPPKLAGAMPSLIPDLEMHVLKDCGHWSTWERPEEVAGLIRDWLARRFPV